MRVSSLHTLSLSIAFIMLCGVSVFSQQDSMILIDSLVIYYDSDQFELSSSHDSLLTQYFKDQATSELEFHIDSYADQDGDDGYNRRLSNRRKDAIVDWLRDRQVDDDRIFRRGHGEQYAQINEEVDKVQDRRSEIKVFQRTAYKLFQGAVIIDNLEPVEGLAITVIDNGIIRRIEVDSGRHFSIPIPISREVELQIEAKNHFPVVRTLRLATHAKVSNVKLPMVKMDIGAKVSLHVQFVGNKSIVLHRFKPALNILASVLKKSDEICIELAGHIHRPGAVIQDQTNENFGLSIARSIEIHDYLVGEGINPDRLLARGYGNSRMKHPNPTSDAGASANRRVEAIVMACDSTRSIANDHVDDLEYYNNIGKNAVLRW